MMVEEIRKNTEKWNFLDLQGQELKNLKDIFAHSMVEKRLAEDTPDVLDYFPVSTLLQIYSLLIVLLFVIVMMVFVLYFRCIFILYFFLKRH
jgi:hypothetical protein